MEPPRDQLLPGPRLAGDQDGDVAGGDAVDDGQHLLGPGVGRDELVAVLLPRQETSHQVDEGAGRGKRLGDVVRGAEVDRLHRLRDGAEGGQDDDLRRPGPRPDAPKQLDPVHLRHPAVGEDDVDRGTVQEGERLCAVARFDHGMAGFLEDLPDHGPERGFVVDDQDSSHALVSPRRDL